MNIVAEVVATPVDTPVVNAENITNAQLLEREWDDDEEFAISLLLNMINYYHHFLDNDEEGNMIISEEFALPDDYEYGEPPFFVLASMMEQMLNSNWGAKVHNRMRRQVAGVAPKVKLTDEEKANHPDYMLCECCVEYCEKTYYRRVHIHTAKHKNRMIERGMRPAGKKKVADALVVYSAKKIFDGMDRVFANRKANEPELVEEQIETSDSEVEIEDITYVVKTWDKNGEYAGLFEVDGVKYWDNLEEATEKYGWAIDCGDMEAVELVKIDPNSEDRETIIYDWEGEVEVEVEVEDA